MDAAALGTIKEVKRLINYSKPLLMTRLAASRWPCGEGRLSRQGLHRAGVLCTRTSWQAHVGSQMPMWAWL